MKRTWKIITLAGICVAAAALPLHAVWMLDGPAVCTEAGTQEYPTTVSDGAGGAIVVWIDKRGDVDGDLYAQRIDSTGATVWTANGRAVCAVAGAQYGFRAIADGAGGAIVVWRDERSGADPAVYAQRINPSGFTQWTAGGVAVCAVPDAMNVPRIAADGSGGVIVVWESGRGVDYDIYAQRVDASGAVQWTADGAIVCNAKYDQTDARIVADGAGGAIVFWTDDRNANDDVYAQRIDASCVTQWATNGVPVCTDAAAQDRVEAVTDGAGGAIAVWEDPRGGADALYAQRIDDKGGIRWTANGIPLCVEPAAQQFPGIAADGAGGALVVWHDSRAGNYDGYVQRVDAAGALLWGTSGTVVCGLTASQYYLSIVSDGAGGAFVSWNDARDGDYDVYAQRVDAAGNVMWTADGILVCGETGEQNQTRLLLADESEVLVAWRDMRDGNYDIYAARIALVHPDQPAITAVADVPRDQGGKLTIHWDASASDALPLDEITHYSVWRRLPAPVAATGGGMPPLPVDFAGQAVRLAAGGWSWEWLANVPARYVESYAFTATSLFDSTGTDPGWQHFIVTAHTAAQSVFYDSPVDSGYSVDNLSPAVPVGAIAEQRYAPEGLQLSWAENGETDLRGYAIYRGTDPAFVPAPENLVAEPAAASWFDDGWRWDAGYRYRIAAVDVHGNESGYVLIAPEDVTGDEPPAAPAATALAQNWPNPFNPYTSIAFDLAAEGRVSLRVYDAAGRLVAVLVDGARPAGRHRVEWDGKDARGLVAASGVYFYRLDAGSFRETRKMILLR